MNEPPIILLVDDNEDNLKTLIRPLKKKVFDLLLAQSGEEALNFVKHGSVDLILLDIMMPKMSGIEVLKTIRANYSTEELPIIMATAKTENESIIQAINLGANDYVTKPINLPVLIARITAQLSRKKSDEAFKQTNIKLKELNQTLELRIENRTRDLSETNRKLNSEIEERKRMEEKLKKKRDELETLIQKRDSDLKEIERLRRKLEAENMSLREEVPIDYDLGEFVGQSFAMKKVLEQIELVAKTEAGVLLQGETGTGKELVTRLIHERSARSNYPLVKVNCVSIPRDLFESEFFGHVKGAFTGALKDRMGRFQLADEGTLFLDEVSEIPLDLQGKLLRVLQEGEFERIGDDQTKKVNVRIIAATNRDLLQEVKEGRFRSDLFYRLSVVPIHIPPLRERPEAIRPLTEHFIKCACARLNRGKPQLTEEFIDHLEKYHWPGNVRELQNIIERSIIISPDGVLRANLQQLRPVAKSASKKNANKSQKITPFENLKQTEKVMTLEALKKTNGKVYGPNGAASLLGVPASTLAYRIKKWGFTQ